MFAKHTPYALRPLLVAGFASLVAWLGVYILFFSHTLWQAPTLIPDHWPKLFYPIQNLFPWAWVHAHHDQKAGWPNLLAWLVLTALLFAFWGWALRAAGRLPAGDSWLLREGGRIVLIGTLFFSALLVFSPGLTSQDLYSNIWYSKMAAVYGASPFTHAPLDFFWQDRQGWLQWVFWKTQPAVYGPAWVLPATLAGWVAEHIDGDIVSYLLTQRIPTALIHVANTALVWSLAGRIWPAAPGRRLQATLFYGWCPLVVWEFADNAHNDALLVFWVLVALWCHFKGTEHAARVPEKGLGLWWMGAVAALTLAGDTKATGFLLLPAYIMLLWRTAGGPHPWLWRAALTLGAGALVLGLTGLLYWPYWEGPATLQVLITAPGNKLYANSLGEVVRFRVPEIMHWLGKQFGHTGYNWSIGVIGDSLETWLRPRAQQLAGLLILLFTLQVRDVRSLIRSWGWIFIAYILIGTMWFWPWYLTWVIPLAALAGRSRLRAATVLYTLGGMALYALAPNLPPPLNAQEGYVPLLLFGPVALYLAGCVVADAGRAVRRLRAVHPLRGLRDAWVGIRLVARGLRRPIPVPAEWRDISRTPRPPR